MKLYILSKLVFLFVLTILTTNIVWADLMIAPQRIVFDERQRSATVNLINTSSRTNTYRLFWTQKKQLPNSDYLELPIESDEVPNASKMLRFSPRQVTLKSGERQTIRISLRRPQGMRPGEHRSHLLFQSLPSDDQNTNPSERGARIKINLLLGFAIPVIIRQGKTDVRVKISDITYQKIFDRKKMFYRAGITFRRFGVHAAYGSVNIMWKPNGSPRYKQVGILNNVAIYPENTEMQAFVSLTNFKPAAGKLKFEYVGRKEYEGVLFASAKTIITKNDFILTKLESIQ